MILTAEHARRMTELWSIMGILESVRQAARQGFSQIEVWDLSDADASLLADLGYCIQDQTISW